MSTSTRVSGLLLGLAFASFVVLAMPSASLGVAWPSVRETFGLGQSGFGLILWALSLGAILSSTYAAQLLQGRNAGVMFTLSTLVVIAGLAGYVVATTWWAFLGATLIIGLGAGVINVGLNAYAAYHFSPRHMNWMHACYGIGALLGPLLLTQMLLVGTWRGGYVVLLAFPALMAVAYWLTRQQWGDGAVAAATKVSGLGMREALRNPRVWLQMSLFGAYTGLEMTAGQWSFTLFTEARGVSIATAGQWVSLFWGSLMVGRFVMGIVVVKLGMVQLMRLAMLGTLGGAVLMAVPAHPYVGAGGLVCMGLCLAPMFPGLMSETPRRLGPDLTGHAIGFQISASMVAAALIPWVVGLLTEAFDLTVIGIALVVVALVLLALHERLIHTTDRQPAF